MNAPITTASVPAAWCNLTLQEIWPKLASLLQVEIPATAYNYGPDTPAPDDQDKPWLKTDASYVPERWYVYASGAWIARHPIAPGVITMYLGTEASIETFDGGEAGVVAYAQGPMWEKVSAFDARFPVGVGTFAASGGVLVGGTGGADKHTLTRDELPDITIDTPLKRRTDLADGGSSTALFEPSFTLSSSVSVDVPTEVLGEGDAHNNLPPYIAVFFIRRTARTHYRN